MRVLPLLFTASAAALAQTPPPGPPTHADMPGMSGMTHSDMIAPKVQAFFTNGMQLAHAFAHGAAIAAMAEAAR